MFENDDYSGTTDELIESEQLKSFSVLDKYCEICGDIVPHHIDENYNNSNLLEENPDFVAVKPMSDFECVVCRQKEEVKLDLTH
jgi:hypothetical protein